MSLMYDVILNGVKQNNHNGLDFLRLEQLWSSISEHFYSFYSSLSPHFRTFMDCTASSEDNFDWSFEKQHFLQPVDIYSCLSIIITLQVLPKL